MKKRLLSVFAALLMLAGFVYPVMAVSYGNVDMGYSGRLDIVSGEPPEEAADGTVQSNRVNIDDGGIYDRTTGTYCYVVDGAEVQMNVPNAAVTTGAVAITLPEGLTARLFRNGEELKNESISYIDTPGKYVLRFSDTEKMYLEFTVVGSVTGIITGYQLPAGFSIKSATLDGKKIAASSYIDMSQEGSYEITYYCSKTGIEHYLNVSIDHTPPTLKLENVENGYAKGPVDISDAADDTVINVFLNGNLIKADDVLTESGTYRILIQDVAGNTTSYSFVLGVYFNWTAVMFIVLLFLILVALGVYLYISRKKMRVR